MDAGGPICPDCGRQVEMGPTVMVDDRVACPHCHAELEVISLDPPELDWAYEGPDGAGNPRMWSAGGLLQPPRRQQAAKPALTIERQADRQAREMEMGQQALMETRVHERAHGLSVPLDAEVQCSDGPAGRSISVTVNPETRQVTHLVVRERRPPHTERLVPLRLVADATANRIHLRCTGAELQKAKPFVYYQYEERGGSIPMGGAEMRRLPSYQAHPRAQFTPVRHQRIPEHELLLHKGVRVKARDGYVGNVDEFLVDPADGQISYLILREGHLWSSRDICVPISQIERIGEKAVHLTVEKDRIRNLPAVPPTA